MSFKVQSVFQFGFLFGNSRFFFSFCKSKPQKEFTSQGDSRIKQKFMYFPLWVRFLTLGISTLLRTSVFCFCTGLRQMPLGENANKKRWAQPEVRASLPAKTERWQSSFAIPLLVLVCTCGTKNIRNTALQRGTVLETLNHVQPGVWRLKLAVS